MSERAVWRSIGRVLLVAAVLVGAVGTWSWLASQSQREQHVYWQPVAAVEVDGGGADVKIAAGAADRVTVQESMEWAIRKPAVSLRLVGQTLKIKAQCRTPFVTNLCSVSLTVQVPAQTSVQTLSGSGATEVTGTSGKVRAQAQSGQVVLHGLSGQVWAQCTSGEIIGTGLGSSQVQAAVSSGRIDLGFAKPPQSVTATATSGTVRVSVPPDGVGYRVDGHTTSGSWMVDPSLNSTGSPRHIDVSLTSGDVEVLPTPPGAAADSSSVSTTPTTEPTVPATPTTRPTSEPSQSTGPSQTTGLSQSTEPTQPH
ncbi:DUF4097 family beta strand repeat-containing protein [Kitasatospora sp. NPDC002227]|uniref:DUF4097 family beta strand repeat-containing protein n=1 Tax=Kitasatospora sp. NPDC002227 TaxID=3154773 RepID=UPI003330F8B9